MKRKILISITLCALPLWGSAQNANGNVNTSFGKYRQQMLDGFQGFRKSVLDDYDKFLDGVWKEYSKFVGEDRDPRPKPQKAPVAPPTPAPAPPVKQTPTVPKEEPKPKPQQPVAQTPKPTPNTQPPTPKPQHPTPKPQPPTPNTPPPTPVPAKPQTEYRSFSFYGVQVRVPKLDYSAMAQTDLKTFGKSWRELKALKVEKQILPVLNQTATACGLNDWFRYELAEAYVGAELSAATPAARISLLHYLLVHQGLGARIAYTDQMPLLLMTMQQMVYARPYLNVGGTRFYIFTDKLSGDVKPGNGSYYSCDIPENTDAGRPFDLIVRPLNMPERNKNFTIQYNGLVLQGQVNTNIIDMVRHYPQMPIPDYARSNLCPQLRQSLVRQMSQQLASQQGLQAVNRLLRFVQKAFDYATDQDFHGYEKPYFVEEILFYPRCDCEDRSVFFAYLAKNVLGVENCLLHYPGHECTAIVLPGMTGDGFTLGGKNYFITDPTYIGADAGMCMPQFKNTSPEVEFWY